MSETSHQSVQAEFTATLGLVAPEAERLNLKFASPLLRGELNDVQFLTVFDAAALGWLFVSDESVRDQAGAMYAAMVLQDAGRAAERLLPWVNQHAPAISRHMHGGKADAVLFWPPHGRAHHTAVGAIMAAAAQAIGLAEFAVTFQPAGARLLGDDNPDRKTAHLASLWPRFRQQIVRDFPASDLPRVAQLSVDELHKLGEMTRPCPLVLHGQGRQAEYKGQCLPILPLQVYRTVEAVQSAWPRRRADGELRQLVGGDPQKNMRYLLGNPNYLPWRDVISKPRQQRPRVIGYGIAS